MLVVAEVYSMSAINLTQFAKSALADESRTAEIYRRLSKNYGKSQLGARFGSLAEAEVKHALFWTEFLKDRGIDAAGIGISRLRVVMFMLVFKLFGVGLGLKLLEKGEHAAIAGYGLVLGSETISQKEKATIKGILTDELGHEDEFEEYGKRYKLFVERVAVILTQMSGGLVTVLSVTAGLAGVYSQPFVAGIAGMLVGLTQAANSASSFYFYSKTEKQIKLGVLSRLKTAVDVLPEVFVKKLVSHLEKDSLSERAARTVGEEAAQKKDLLRKMIAEQKYSIDEGKLGNPAKTAFYAGVFRVLGTFLPLIPYFANLPTSTALPLSVLITLATLALMGFLVAVSAEVSVRQKIVELIISGLVLTGIALAIGMAASRLVGLLE